jgi:hypothetical protein
MLLNKLQKILFTASLVVMLTLSASIASYAQKNPPRGDNGCAHVVPPEDNDSGGAGSNNPQDDGTNGPSCKEDKVDEDPGPSPTPGDTTPTPEPITMLLFGSGLAGIGYARRRYNQVKEESKTEE